MNRDQIDDLMQENGIVVVGEAVYALVQLVIEHEREACAKVCEQPIDEIQITDNISDLIYMDGCDCAEAIRARSKHE